MEKKLFCQQWQFGKAGEAKRYLDLPHDAMQEQGRRADAPSGRSEAFFLGGKYEYEKTLFAPLEWAEQVAWLEFEGVYPNAKVLLNGKELGGCNYGYSQFRVELTGLRYGENNTITVLVDDEGHPNSRWYGGAGIYRPVHLITAPKHHIQPDGIRVTTLAYAPAEILVEVKHNVPDGTANIEILLEGKVVAAGSGESCKIPIPDAKLWDAEHPKLYTCRVTVGEDQAETKFGIRKIEYSRKGLFINGQQTLLKGGCVHHDHGILGARTYDVSEYRRIKRLKEFGFNAIRSAHNPLSRAALDACDELGMYVMDEAWDTWTNTKSPYDHGVDFLNNYQTDLELLVAKDYNHPCVIMYSIGNEVTEPAKPEGVELGEKLVAAVKALDTTRPVTAGINLTLMFLASLKNNPLDNASEGSDHVKSQEKMDSTAYNKMVMGNGKKMTRAAGMGIIAGKSKPILDALDICGYNYAVSRYKKDRKKRTIVGSETYCYELGEVWPLVEKYPHLIGDFMWTAWDYIGEVGIGSWSYAGDSAFDKQYPWLLADTGALDILGNDNAEAGLAAIVWDARTTPYIAVTPANRPGVTPIMAMWRGSNAIPHWSWQGCEGNAVDVEVYSKAPEVELFVNGASIGKEKTKHFKAVFHTTYVPGEVKAVAHHKDGTKTESVLRSATGETAVRITRENSGDVVYLAIDLTGANGEIECNADRELAVSVEGGELLAFGSANPCTEENYLSGSYTSYYGRAQAVVRVKDDTCRVTVTGAGLRTAAQELK